MRIIATRPRPLTDEEKPFAQRLEERAQKVISAAFVGLPNSPALASVRGELALALDQLQSARAAHGRVLAELAEITTSVEHEIHRFTPPASVYQDVYREIREPLRERWLRLRSEHRRAIVAATTDLRPLHDRLLTLLLRHRQLASLYEHRNPRSKT